MVIDTGKDLNGAELASAIAARSGLVLTPAAAVRVAKTLDRLAVVVVPAATNGAVQAGLPALGQLPEGSKK